MMIDIEHWSKRSPEEILAEINNKSDTIVKVKKQRDKGAFKTVNAALALQQLEGENAALRGLLGPLRAIPDCGRDLTDDSQG